VSWSVIPIDNPSDILYPWMDTDAAVPSEAWGGLPLDRFITTNVIWRKCHELITHASNTKLVIQLIFISVKPAACVTYELKIVKASQSQCRYFRHTAGLDEVG